MQVALKTKIVQGFPFAGIVLLVLLIFMEENLFLNFRYAAMLVHFY